MPRGKRRLGTKSEMVEPPAPAKYQEKLVVKPAWEQWAESIDLSVEACAARQAARPHVRNGAFKDKATKALEQKLASAVPGRAWASVRHAFNQYGNYLELIS